MIQMFWERLDQFCRPDADGRFWTTYDFKSGDYCKEMFRIMDGSESGTGNCVFPLSAILDAIPYPPAREKSAAVFVGTEYHGTGNTRRSALRPWAGTPERMWYGRWLRPCTAATGISAITPRPAWRPTGSDYRRFARAGGRPGPVCPGDALLSYRAGLH